MSFTSPPNSTLLAAAALTAAFAFVSPAQAQNEIEIGILPDAGLQTQADTTRMLARLRHVASRDGGSALFGQLFTSDAEFESRADLTGFEMDGRGGLAGFQSEIYEGLTVGAAFSRQSGDIDQASQGGASYKTMTLHTFSELDLQGLRFGLEADYGRSEYNDIFRAVTAAPGSVTGDTDGSHWRLAASVGTDLEFDGGLQISPSLTYDYTHAVVDAFSETGPSSSTLDFARQSVNLRRLTAAVDVAFPVWDVADGIAVMPVADLRYSRALSGEAHSLALQSGTHASLPLSMPGYSGSGFDASLGADVLFDNGWTIGARYGRAFSGDLDGSRTIGLSLSRRF